MLIFLPTYSDRFEYLMNKNRKIYAMNIQYIFQLSWIDMSVCSILSIIQLDQSFSI